MNVLDATEIIRLLEAPTDDRRPIGDLISAKAPVTALTAALQEARTPLVRQILCDILGERYEEAAIPFLIDALDDVSAGVRSSAADALAKIGSPRAGEPLLKRLAAEKDAGVRTMLAAALGAVGHKPSIPLLIKMLEDQSGAVRGCAAWSLGALKAKEAEDAIRLVLARETNEYAIDRMKEALAEIGTK